MELASPNIKKFLIFSYILGNTTSKPNLPLKKRKKKITPPPPPSQKKIPYISRNYFLALILKKFFMFSQKEAFLILSQKKDFLISPKISPCIFQPSPKNKRNLRKKNLLYFRKQKPSKYFLCFRKPKLYKSLLYFRR